MRGTAKPKSGQRRSPAANVDPTRLEIFKHVFHSVAEEMGAVLRKTSYSARSACQPHLRSLSRTKSAVLWSAGREHR